MGRCLNRLKGTVHQIYECVSDVLLHLERMSGIVFSVQSAQIWPKNEKRCFSKMYPKCTLIKCLKGHKGHFSRQFFFAQKLTPSIFSLFGCMGNRHLKCTTALARLMVLSEHKDITLECRRRRKKTYFHPFPSLYPLSAQPDPFSNCCLGKSQTECQNTPRCDTGLSSFFV